MTALSLIGLLAFGIDGSCPPIALLEGDPALVQTVSGALHDRGVRADPIPQCGAVAVHLQPRGGEVFVEIQQGAGRVFRTAGDSEGAATIIESWARVDLTAPLLSRVMPPDVRHPIQAPPGARYVPPPEPPTAISASPRPFALSAGAVVGMADDRSAWGGFALQGCFQLWHLCLGGRFQYAVDMRQGGNATRLGGERSLLDLALTADVPFVLGRFELVPGIAVGLAQLQSERPFSNREVKDDTGGARLRAHLGFGWRFSPHWTLRMDAAVDYAPAAHTRLFESLVDDGPEDVELPSEPRVVGWLRLGLEVGGI